MYALRSREPFFQPENRLGQCQLYAIARSILEIPSDSRAMYRTVSPRRTWRSIFEGVSPASKLLETWLAIMSPTSIPALSAGDPRNTALTSACPCRTVNPTPIENVPFGRSGELTVFKPTGLRTGLEVESIHCAETREATETKRTTTSRCDDPRRRIRRACRAPGRDSHPGESHETLPIRLPLTLTITSPARIPTSLAGEFGMTPETVN